MAANRRPRRLGRIRSAARVGDAQQSPAPKTMRYSFLAAVAAAALAASPVLAKRQTARISMAAAKAEALKVVPHGRIKAAELEREHGRLIYSFDIAVPRRTGIEEVQINALDGSLV